VLVRENPHLQVHVSAAGAPHVVDPTKLVASARRLYGEAFDVLWGEIAGVPETNVHVTGDRVLDLACFSTPGHASHHVSYMTGDGTLFGGDVTGVRVAPASFVLPPTPPPDIDLEAWERSLADIERRHPSRLALPHFGVIDDVPEHLARLRYTLREWSERVAHGMDQATFAAAALADIAASDPGLPDVYLRAAPVEHCFDGLERYWRKRRESIVAAAS
jgi:glyoxylase-like metal-dependent hydrolase (beta-lactamase superfamily II)